jgi:hypothetical protein
MSAVGMTDGEFDDILAKVNNNLSKMSLTSQSLYDTASMVWDWIPPWLKNDVDHALRKMMDIAQKVFDFLKEFIENPGWPPALWNAADTWTNDVGSKASSVAGRATLNYVHADDHWTGPAATAYKNALPAQSAAAAAIKTMCDALDSALKNMAAAIVVFWLACAAALISAIPEFGGEEAAADTGVGILPAILAFVGSVVKLLGIIAAAAAALWAFAGSQIGPYVSINQQLNNWTAFPPRNDPQGDWPQASTAATSDGSFTDGNPSQWRYQG